MIKKLEDLRDMVKRHTFLLLIKEKKVGAFLVAQWLGVHPPMRGHRFEPWSGKIPHAAEQLSPCAAAAGPAL